MQTGQKASWLIRPSVYSILQNQVKNEVGSTSLVKQLLVVTRRYIILQRREKIDRSLFDQNLNMLRFYEGIKRGLFVATF